MTIRIPDPKANTTTEAYLAYKAGFLEESELKPVLYEPYLHFDAWLAYWAGLTNTYPTDKNGNPEMLTDEEALVAHLSGVTNTYPEEIKDPYDVRIEGYLKHLVSIRWPEPDYPVNNEEFYLSTMEPTHTSNSEPSTDIELDTAEEKIISVEAYGDTHQQTYSGYNLIDLVPITNTQPNAYQQCTLETVMDATLGRNVLHITGAGNYPSVIYQLSQRLESGKYYALKFTYRSTVSGSPQDETMWFAPNWSANAWDVLGSLADGKAKPGDGDTVTSAEQSTTWKTTSRRFYVDPSQYSSSSTSYTNICFSLGYNSNATKELWLANAELYEITEDDWNADTYTSKDYEPYTGGVSAPNPEYPQDIQVVTGEQTVRVTGKNLWGGFINDYSLTDHDVAFVNYKDGSISANGTASSSAYSMYAAAAASEGRTQQFSAGTYTLSGGTNVVRAVFIIVGPGTNYITDASTGEVTFTLSETVSGYIRAYVPSGMSANETIHPQLELGSTATAYESYQSQSYTVNLGSIELCKIGDYQDYIYKSGDDWYVHKAMIKATFNGTENWALHNTQNNINGFRLDANAAHSDGAIVANSYRKVLMSEYSYNRGYYMITTLETEATGSNYRIYMTQPDSSVITLEDFTTWLGINNVTAYYASQTPTDTKITDATLVGQLEALVGADTYNEKTYIKVTATDPNLPALLKVEAYKY